MDIMTGLAAISKTLEIIKELRQVDRQIDQADLKLRIADLADKLLVAKKALIDAEEREQKLRDEIESLKRIGGYEDENGLLFRLDEQGKRSGQPFCNQCFVKEDKLFRMLRTERQFGHGYTCTNCKIWIPL